MKTVTLFHHNSSLKTLQDFMDAEGIKGISANDLFKENKEAIFNQMSPDEKAAYAKKNGKDSVTKDDLKSSMTLPCPCVLKIHCKYVTREVAISQTNFEENTDNLYAFENDHIQNILQDSGYRIDISTRKYKPGCCVFGWFKSLYYIKEQSGGKILRVDNNRNNERNFIEISPFIMNLSTDVTSDGGSFSFTVPVIHSVSLSDKNNSEGGCIPRAQAKRERSNNAGNALRTDMYYYNNNKEFFHKIGVNTFHSNFFNWLIQSNDLVFISFEELEMERDSGIKMFDMIGLVERVIESQDANGNGTVTVSGRDLMKLINDDSSLFFNTSSAWGNSQIFANEESAGKQGDIRDVGSNDAKLTSMQRIRRSTNEIDVFAAPFNRNISFIIKGVISQLANIEVVPGETFTAWGDRRTKFNDLYPGGAELHVGGGRGSGGASNGNQDTPQEEEINEEFRTGLEYNASSKDYHENKGGFTSGNDGGDLEVPREQPVKSGSFVTLPDGMGTIWVER